MWVICSGTTGKTVLLSHLDLDVKTIDVDPSSNSLGLDLERMVFVSSPDSHTS